MVGHPFFLSRVDGKEKGGTLRTRWWTIATAATLVLLLAGAVQAATLNVGPGQTYTTIQAAVTAALAGDTIQVAAGVYDEQVYITKTLTVQGAGDTTVIRPSAGSKLAQVITYGATTHRGIVEVAANGANITLRNLYVDGTSITNLAPYTAYYYSGILYFDSGGLIDHVTVANVAWATGASYADGIWVKSVAQNIASMEISNCRVQNVSGINIVVKSHSGSASSVIGNVHHNTIVGRGSQSTDLQNGIQFQGYVGSGVGESIANNVISDLIWAKSDIWTSSGILAVTTPTALAITSNVVTNSDCGIVAANEEAGSNVNVSSNSVSGVSAAIPGKSYSGIYLVGLADENVSSATVHGNTIGGGYTAGIIMGAYGPAAVAATVSGNTLAVGGAGDGILDDSDGGVVTATLSGNSISNWADGIHFLSSAPVAGYTITGNSIAGNTFGLRNDNAGTVVAVNNWWGSASGPGPVGTGTGDKVSARVTYNPWYVDAAMTTLSNVAPANVYVSSTYMDGNAGGHAFGYDAFTTIQAGINAVAAGGTVNVAAGTYAEQVTITKALTLQGAGATTVIKPSSLTTYVITPSVAGSTVCTGAVVVNNAGGNVVVKDLKVDASSLNTNRTLWFTPSVALMKFAGVFYCNTSGTIDNVVSTNTNHVTIPTGSSPWGSQVHSFWADADATSARSIEIKNCTASSYLTDGIMVGWNSTNITANINHNTIAGDGSRRQYGIQVYAGVTVTSISYNTISNLVNRTDSNWNTGINVVRVQSGAVIEYNTLSNCDFGIIDTFSSGVTIQHNTITGSGHQYGTGVYLDNGTVSLTGLIVHANTIGSGFPAGGICLRGWYAGTNTISESITDNILTGNGTTDGYGIYDWSGAAGGITSTITGNTITGWAAGIFIDAGAPVSGFTISWNSIAGNATGINASSLSGNIDATDNYWGSASGPSGGLADPVTGKLANGTGDKVSANVLFDPWTGMSTECVVTEPGQGVGDTVTNPCAQTSVEIETAGGTTDVTIAKYTSAPPDTPSFGGDATYVDIQLSNPAAVSEMIITFTDMSPGTVMYFYRPGTGWIACSNQTQVGTTITVTVTASTTPTLAELVGTIFAEGTAKGNVNGDSVIDVLDARLCLQIATGFLAGTPVQRAAADVDNDGDVDLTDAQILAQYIIGIITELGPGAE